MTKVERWEYYNGSTPVIYGHYAHSKSPRIQNNTHGIDTGCCHGDCLTILFCLNEDFTS